MSPKVSQIVRKCLRAHPKNLNLPWKHLLVQLTDTGYVYRRTRSAIVLENLGVRSLSCRPKSRISSSCRSLRCALPFYHQVASPYSDAQRSTTETKNKLRIK